MNLSCDMGEAVPGIGYQFYGRSGLLGTRVTTGITNPLPGIYEAIAQPPNGAIGIRWNNASNSIYATSPIPPVVGTQDAEPFETARQLIYEKFSDGWGNLLPATFEGMSAKEESAKWARLSISFGGTDEPTVGRNFTRTVGIVYLSVFSVKEEGTKAFTQAADRMRRIFARARLGADATRLRFATVTLIDVGTRDGYRQKNVACNFTLDQYDTP